MGLLSVLNAFFRNFFAKSFVISNNNFIFAATYSPRFPLEQRAQGESFLSFLPCSVFSYSINAEENRSDIDKFVLNHIIVGNQCRMLMHPFAKRTNFAIS